MYIFVDESGIFANPEKKPSVVSCVGALIISESSLSQIEEKFIKIRRSWGQKAEVKASSLSESQANEVFQMLHRYGVVFEAALIDLGVVGEQHIEHHRQQQLQNLQNVADRSRYKEFKDETIELKNRLSVLSAPLYTQMIMMTVAVSRSIELGTLYFVQRIPKELSNFYWVIDAKDKDRTEYEKLWTEMVLPFIQSETFRKPYGLLKGADYSHFERFSYSKVPEYVSDLISDTDPRPTNTRMLLGEKRRFANSKSVIGLQLVDIATTTLRRALAANFKVAGFKALGALMIRRREGSLRLSFPTDEIYANAGRSISVPYSETLKIIEKNNRSMLTKSFYKNKTT